MSRCFVSCLFLLRLLFVGGQLLVSDISNGRNAILRSDLPSSIPSDQPSYSPSGMPSDFPSNYPSDFPSLNTIDVHSAGSETASKQINSPNLASELPSDFPSLVPANVAKVSEKSDQSDLPEGSSPRCNPIFSQFQNKRALDESKPLLVSEKSGGNVKEHQPNKSPTAVMSDTIEARTDVQSDFPSMVPTSSSSDYPSGIPSEIPSDVPSLVSSTTTSDSPSGVPSEIPSDVPSLIPSSAASDFPSDSPTGIPSDLPSMVPSSVASDHPSANPTVSISDMPSQLPTVLSSNVPSLAATLKASSKIPSDAPTSVESLTPNPTTDTNPSISKDLLALNPTIEPTSSISPTTLAPSLNEMEVSSKSQSPSADTIQLMDDITIDEFEDTCAEEFLQDFLPLIYPAEYDDLACEVVSQSIAGRTESRRIMEETDIPYKTNGIDVLLRVTSSVQLPEGVIFDDIVAKTFTMFSSELQQDLSEASDFFEDKFPDGGARDITPIVEDASYTMEKTMTRAFWGSISASIVGGAILALLLSFIIMRRRSSDDHELPYHNTKTTRGLDSAPSNMKPRDHCPSQETQSSRHSDSEMMPATPVGPAVIPTGFFPDMVDDFEGEVTSELSPTSQTGREYTSELQNSDSLDAVLMTKQDCDNFSDTLPPVELLKTQSNISTGSSSVYTSVHDMDDAPVAARSQSSSTQRTADLQGLDLLASQSKSEVDSKKRAGVQQYEEEKAPARRTFFTFSPWKKEASPLQDQALYYNDGAPAESFEATLYSAEAHDFRPLCQGKKKRRKTSSEQAEMVLSDLEVAERESWITKNADTPKQANTSSSTPASRQPLRKFFS